MSRRGQFTQGSSKGGFHDSRGRLTQTYRSPSNSVKPLIIPRAPPPPSRPSSDSEDSSDSESSGGSSVSSSGSFTSTSDSTSVTSDDDEPPLDGDKRPRYTLGKNRPSVRMAHFLDHEAAAAFEAYSNRYSPPYTMSACMSCKSPHTPQSTTFRCTQCIPPMEMCEPCILSHHSHNPFHVVEQWHPAQPFWQRVHLGSLGLVIHLGHDGNLCPCSTQTRPMTVVHEHGVEVANVMFCRCVPKGQSTPPGDAIQLLEAGFWPGTWDGPRTAFTLPVMKQFQRLANIATVNAHDFIASLVAATDNVDPDGVPDRCREFLTSMREFTYIQMCQRKGSRPMRCHPAGSLAVLCPACPQPTDNMNMDPLWKERPESERFLDALFHAVDGNFHQNLKDKPSDPDDFPLTLGAAYFANETEFKAFMDTLGAIDDEVSTCHRFGAMGYSGHVGKVSGTVGLSCARHMFVLPCGGVDLQKGERFANVDFAMLHGLQRWFPLLLHISAYDINCQYIIHFRRRMEALGKHSATSPSLSFKTFPTMISIIAGIGKYHLPCHCLACQLRFSFNFLPGVGMTDGEGPERIWSTLNALGNRTREMSAGHRHDVINNFHGHMNWKRTITMPTFLRSKYSEAKEFHRDYTRLLKSIEDKMTEDGRADLLETWKEKERVYRRDVVDKSKHAGLENVYEIAADKRPSKQKVMSHISTSELKPLWSTSPDLMGAIEEGIEIQELQALVIAELTLGHAREMSDLALKELQNRLRERSRLWQSIYNIHLAPLVTAATGNEPPVTTNLLEVEDDPPSDSETTPPTGKRKRTRKRAKAPPSMTVNEAKAIEILLPSSYPADVRQDSVFTQAVAVEIELRKRHLNDTLDSLRGHLITRFSLKKREKESKGQKHRTRAQATLSRLQHIINRTTSAYRRNREGLLTLLHKDDDPEFPPLLDSDVRSYVFSFEQQKLGGSREKPSWIWNNASFADSDSDEKMTDFYTETSRVNWFRTSALKSRWWEEEYLVVEEMRRTVRFFKWHRTDWEVIAEEREAQGRYGEAGYARKQVHVYERLIAKCRKTFKDIKDVVDVDSITCTHPKSVSKDDVD